MYESRKKQKEEMSDDKGQDKSMIKKGVKQHESALHKGQPKTELKLKTGGRAKKAAGTVKKYKCGGGVYGAKKTDKDIKNIDDAKDCKPKMLANGKSVKKMQVGGLAGALAGGAAGAGMGRMPVTAMAPKMDARTAMEEKLKQREMEKMARAKKYLSPSQQGELISQSPEAAGLTPPAAPAPAAAAPSAPMAPMKKGGKAKRMSTGGSLKEVDADKNPGLSKLPTEARNKMGYMRHGGKAKKMNTGGTCS